MAHVFEPATTGRSKCRGCGKSIARGELRFGENVPNLFADGDTTLWFHPVCAAYKRPQSLLETLEITGEGVPDRETLARAARHSLAHERLQRIDGAERAPSGQAKCRHCHEPIEKGSWRIRVVFFDEGRFAPGGSVHLDCREAYFGTPEMLDPVLHFSSALGDTDRADLTRHLMANAT